MVGSKALNNLVDSWMDIVESKNLTPRQSTKEGERIYWNSRALEIIRYSIVCQAMKEGLISEDDFDTRSIEGQLQAVAEITCLLGKDNI